MKFSKLMAVVLFPLTLVACGENDVDKLNKLKAEYQTITQQISQCANDDACNKAKARAEELLGEIKAVESKLLNKAIEKMNGK